MSCKHSILKKNWCDWVAGGGVTQFFIGFLPAADLCPHSQRNNRATLQITTRLFLAQISNEEDVFAPAVSKVTRNETTATSWISLTNKLHLSYSWASDACAIMRSCHNHLITSFGVRWSGLTIWFLTLNQWNQSEKKSGHGSAPDASRASLSIKCVIDAVISCILPSLRLRDDLACS